MSGAYYNEYEPYAAQWLRNLIKAGLIADGEVDTRSIELVSADDVRGFAQAHWFAGIGGWPYALRLAGWPDDRPVWTGSCPCQPFSVAGKGLGESDPRHLWPHFFRLISSARPPVVMGEQVAGAAGYGWLDGVRADLAREGYASRGVDIPACAIDAPHIRSRLYWVASRNLEDACDDGAGRFAGEADYQRWDAVDAGAAGLRCADGPGLSGGADARGARSDVADADHSERRADGAGRHDDDGAQAGWQQGASDAARRRDGGRLADAAGCGRREERADAGRRGAGNRAHGRAAGSDAGRLDDADDERLEGHAGHGGDGRGRAGAAGSATATGGGDVADADSSEPRAGRSHHAEVRGVSVAQRGAEDGSAVSARGCARNGTFWSDAVWLTGADGKARRAEPGLPLLAHGIPARVGRLRAYGNAIVPQLAAEVIAAFMEARP